MSQIFHILKFKAIAFLRFESKLTFGTALKNSAGSIVYIAFAFGCYFFIQRLISFLIEDIHVGLFLLHQLISIIFYILFVSINVGNIIVSYSTLYKSNEVTFFISKPVDPTKIFLIKFLDNFFYSSSTLMMIIIALIAGYTSYFKLGYLNFLFLFLNSVAFMFSAGSLGAIILLVVIRLANKFGFKNILYTLAVAYISTIIVFFQLNSPKMLITTVLKYYPGISKDLYLGELIPSISKYLPSEWLSLSGFWLVKGDLNNSLQYFSYQLLLMAILFATALILGYKWYFKTWLINSKISAELRSNKNNSSSFLGRWNETIFSATSNSFLRRDLLMFFREPSQVLHLIVLLFLIIIFMVSVSGIKFLGIGNFYLQTMIYFSIFIFNLLFISTLSLRFIFPLISLEGMAFWKLKSSPVKSSQILVNRVIPFSAMILLVGTGLSFFSNNNLGSELTIFAVTITLFASAAIISMNLGMGGIYSNFKEKNAIRLASSQGASLSFLINIVFMLSLVIILFKPMSRMFLSIMVKKPIGLAGIYQTIVPVIIISSTLVFVFLRIAVNSFKKDF